MRIQITSDNKVIVLYPARLQEQVMTTAEYTLITALSDRKVTAIKFIRSQYNLDLGSAKRLCDTIWEKE